MAKLSWQKILLVFAFYFPTHAHSFDHQHAAFNQLLKEIVFTKGPQTEVDYVILKNNEARLDTYLSMIEAVVQKDFQSWNKNQRLAFLINAYNAFTLKLIVMHYPEIDSIRDLGGLVFSSPWDKKFFTLFGKPSYLDFIEHDLIRKNFEEPRIHFAVNCASRGCPPLLTMAYTADKLDHQLEYATRLFIRDPERNFFNAEKNSLEISSIFKWYKHDFEKAAGTLENYIAPYITDDPDINTLIVNRAVKLKYLDYDWSLNDTRK